MILFVHILTSFTMQWRINHKVTTTSDVAYVNPIQVIIL